MCRSNSQTQARKPTYEAQRSQQDPTHVNGEAQNLKTESNDNHQPIPTYIIQEKILRTLKTTSLTLKSFKHHSFSSLP